MVKQPPERPKPINSLAPKSATPCLASYDAVPSESNAGDDQQRGFVCDRAGIVSEGTNPARRVEKFAENRRERFLTREELERLGSAIRQAETVGIPWTVDESKSTAKICPFPFAISSRSSIAWHIRGFSRSTARPFRINAVITPAVHEPCATEKSG